MSDIFAPLSLVDIIAILLVAVGGLQGFFRGLSGELARLIGAVLAFFAGVWLRAPVGGWIADNTRLEEQAANALAFTVTIILALLIMMLLRMLIKRMVQVVFAEAFDKFAGVIAGLLRMSIMVLIVFLCMNMIPHAYLNRVFGEESAIGRIVVKYVPAVRSTLEDNNIITKKQETAGEEDAAKGTNDNE